jgi:pyruvate/2-oxoglutarate dehydrogenase complex dihydrolipoamide acyltransferase (E2) component
MMKNSSMRRAGPKERIGFLGIILGILFCGPLFTAGAQEAVDNDELEKNQAPVVFINYEGPYARIETREQIRAIGVGLGRSIQNGRTGPLNRYFVIHSVSAPDGDRLDADIFGLGVDVGVDHIRNLRTIVQGYLQESYGYSAGDAALLAQYITVYNAVVRGNWNYIDSRYKQPVIKERTPEKVGLSIRFDEWPGRTLMVIPLGTGRSGSLSAVDTSSITSQEVVEELRRDDDRGIEQRKDMVELKEREADQAAQEAALQREAITQEERRIAEERAAAAREREEAARQRQQNEQAQRTPQEQRQEQQQTAAREAEADKQEEDLNKREQALDQQRTEAAASETRAEQKTAEAQQEREDIARDQQQIIDQTAAQPQTAGGVLGVRIANTDSSLGRIVQVNPSFGSELRSSSLNTVNARTVTFIQGKLLAVAGENRGNGAIRLVELSPQTLEMLRQGDDDIHPGSLLWVSGSDLYAITLSKGVLNLARFNTDFAIQAKSAIAVHPYASVTFYENRLLTQYSDGRAAILDPKTLDEMK